MIRFSEESLQWFNQDMPRNFHYKVNTLRLRQNGRHFTDNILKCIFLNENIWISLKISLKFVPEVQINNIPALVQIMLGTDQATSHYVEQWWLVYWGIYASLGLNELRWSQDRLIFIVEIPILERQVLCKNRTQLFLHTDDQKCRHVSDGTYSLCSTSSATSDTIAMAMRDGNEVFLACLDQTACIHYQDMPFELIHGIFYSTV